MATPANPPAAGAESNVVYETEMLPHHHAASPPPQHRVQKIHLDTAAITNDQVDQDGNNQLTTPSVFPTPGAFETPTVASAAAAAAAAAASAAAAGSIPISAAMVAQNRNSVNLSIGAASTTSQFRGVVVYRKKREDKNILGEVLINQDTTVQDFIDMIASELGYEHARDKSFEIKKNNIPISSQQRTHRVVDFFRNLDDVAVVN